MKRRSRRTIQVLGTSMLLGAVSLTAHAQKTFYIDEQLDFTGNGCPTLPDLNNITSSLQSALQTASWSGSRFTESGAWPQDFMESCSTAYGTGGVDNLYGDAKTLAVYAGHGAQNTLLFGTPHNSVCQVTYSGNMRLGSMNGGQAGYGMWLISNSMQNLGAGANWLWVRQNFGFTNSPAIGDNEPRDFFNQTSSTVNSDAWINVLKAGGDNPIVVSYGDTESNCWSLHNSAKLKGDVWVSPRGSGPTCGAGQPSFWSCWESI